MGKEVMGRLDVRAGPTCDDELNSMVQATLNMIVYMLTKLRKGPWRPRMHSPLEPLLKLGLMLPPHTRITQVQGAKISPSRTMFVTSQNFNACRRIRKIT